jgi:hypothetical protein
MRDHKVSEVAQVHALSDTCAGQVFSDRSIGQCAVTFADTGRDVTQEPARFPIDSPRPPAVSIAGTLVPILNIRIGFRSARLQLVEIGHNRE